MDDWLFKLINAQIPEQKCPINFASNETSIWLFLASTYWFMFNNLQMLLIYVFIHISFRLRKNITTYTRRINHWSVAFYNNQQNNHQFLKNLLTDLRISWSIWAMKMLWVSKPTCTPVIAFYMPTRIWRQRWPWVPPSSLTSWWFSKNSHWILPVSAVHWLLSDNYSSVGFGYDLLVYIYWYLLALSHGSAF